VVTENGIHSMSGLDHGFTSLVPITCRSSRDLRSEEIALLLMSYLGTHDVCITL